MTLAFLLLTFSCVYIWFLLYYGEKNKRLTDEFETLLESAPNAKMITSMKNIILFVNKNAETLFGFTKAELVGQSCSKLLSNEVYTKIGNDRKLKKERLSYKVHIFKKDKSAIPARLEIVPLIKGPKETLFICTFIDLSEFKMLEEDIERITYYDYLTEVPNRLFFEETLQRKMKEAKKKQLSLFLFFIGIDQFKVVNDSLGHKVGDSLLKSIADRLLTSIRAGDYVFRIGGDEFAILTSKSGDEQDIRHFAKRILDLFRDPFRILNKQIKVTASVGISSYPKDGEDDMTLIKKTDLAMYHVKQKGGNNYEIFHIGMDVNYRRKYELEVALDSALSKKQFYLEYQPIIEVPSHRVVGLEALLRWKHPSFGLIPPLDYIPPLDFIPLIEHKPIMKIVGNWVFRTACRQLKMWQKQHEELYISINFSVRQLHDINHLMNLERICREEKLSPQSVVLEITESTFIHNQKKIITYLTQLVEKGFSISIDDFGTKYSSLERLPDLPVSFLKIDKSFIDGIGKNEKDEHIITSIMSLAERLNIKTIAEGVETKEQYDFLVAHHCPYIQGFYFSKPLSPARVSRLLNK